MGPFSRCSAVLLAVLLRSCAAEDPDQDALNAVLMQFMNSPEGAGALQAVGGGDTAAAQAEASSTANTEAAISSAFTQLDGVKSAVQKIRDDEKQRVVRVRDNVKFRKEMLKLLRSTYDELAEDNKALSSHVTSLSKNKEGLAAQSPLPSVVTAAISASGETESETLSQTEASDNSGKDSTVEQVGSLLEQGAVKRTNKEVGAQAMQSIDVLSGQMTALRSKDEAEISALTTHSSERRKLENKIKEQHDMLKRDSKSLQREFGEIQGIIGATQKKVSGGIEEVVEAEASGDVEEVVEAKVSPLRSERQPVPTSEAATEAVEQDSSEEY